MIPLPLLILIKMISNKNLTLKETIDKVKEFHVAFKINNEEFPTANLDEREFFLRYNLMKEENEEYLDAAKRKDIIEIADALGDQLYILCGTILRHGLQNVIEDVFCEIQNSNMSKLDENGKPIYREDGKVMKSNKYFRPDINGILEKYKNEK